MKLYGKEINVFIYSYIAKIIYINIVEIWGCKFISITMCFGVVRSLADHVTATSTLYNYTDSSRQKNI